MRKIRALVVDDSVVVRRIVTDSLEADPGIEVSGVAANGKIALSKVGQLKPDVVILDVEMPVMDGIEALRELRKSHPALPVIMFSTLTERGATATLDALSAGASDYVTKPSNVGGVTTAMQRIRDELVPKIKGFCPGLGVVSPVRVSAVVPEPIRPRPVRRDRAASSRVDAVVIGVSTGGPNALASLLPELPADLAVPVLVVQHMPPLFTRLLAERLDAKSPLSVREAENGIPPVPGTVWIAPGDYHMTVERGPGGDLRLGTNQAAPENSCRPAVDPLFRSAAAAYGAGVLGVVLTGMGRDGLEGCERIHDAGGAVIVQDEASSVVWGMPGFVSRAGIADAELPLDKLATEISARVFTGRSRGALANGARR